MITVRLEQEDGRKQ